MLANALPLRDVSSLRLVGSSELTWPRDARQEMSYFRAAVSAKIQANLRQHLDTPCTPGALENDTLPCGVQAGAVISAPAAPPNFGHFPPELHATSA